MIAKFVRFALSSGGRKEILFSYALRLQIGRGFIPRLSRPLALDEGLRKRDHDENKLVINTYIYIRGESRRRRKGARTTTTRRFDYPNRRSAGQLDATCSSRGGACHEYERCSLTAPKLERKGRPSARVRGKGTGSSGFSPRARRDRRTRRSTKGSASLRLLRP